MAGRGAARLRGPGRRHGHRRGHRRRPPPAGHLRRAPIVDVSLLGLAMWQLSPDIVASGLYGGNPMPKFDRSSSPNPLVGTCRTSDGRFITLMMLQSDRFWANFCEHIGRPDLIEGPPGSSTVAARYTNSKECVAEDRRHLRGQDLCRMEGGPGHPGRGVGTGPDGQ